MAVHVREREPVRIARGGDSTVDLTGRRFMGTLLHPVSPGEMQKLCGHFHRGYKIIVDWPNGSGADHPVQQGDLLEVGGRSYPVCGSVERPGCYLDIYVERREL